MHYWHFIVTGALILSLVMTSGCTGLLMGDLKSEIHDSSSITVPPPLTSIFSVLVSQNNTSLPFTQFPKEEKGETALDNPLPGISVFHVKSGSADLTGINSEGISSATVPSDVEPGTSPRAAPGTSVKPLLATASCSPVSGAKVKVSLIGTPNKTHIADCTTLENGDFLFDVLPSMEKSSITSYTFNFEINASGYHLPAGFSYVVTDMANVSDGPGYTFNVCFQQPSEPNAVAVTRGGIAVIGKIGL